ncbi:hypothetical protein KKC60_05330 [Patescibacteria group bacterium]|nr:hypothetical protein [Patescibacteria group bacterium]
MIDIIPAAALLSAAAVNSKKAEPPQHIPIENNDQSDSRMPSDKKENRGKKKRSGFWIFLGILVLALVIGIVFVAINYDNFKAYFVPTTNTDNQNSAYQNFDEDNDGLTTLEEMAAGTQVDADDTDQDGLPDGYEVENGLNPLDEQDSSQDADNDGLRNIDEYKYQSSINDPDSDRDGFQDGAEVQRGYNPSGDGKIFEK